MTPEPRVLTTMWSVPDAVLVDRRLLGRRRVLTTLLRDSRRGDVVLLSGSMGLPAYYFDSLVAVAMRWLRPDVGLVVADATWTPRSTPGETRSRFLAPLVKFWTQLLLRLMNGPRTHFCFLARSECDDVAEQVGVPRERLHFTPFTTTIWDAEQRQRLQLLAQTPEDFVFSGGNASRDYRLLMDAVDGLDVQVHVATTGSIPSVPSTVTVAPVSHDAFLEAMALSRAVVLPLSVHTRRSGGQQTYLNAMLLGKPTIVTDAPGVRDHVVPDVEALVVPADPAALRRALEWVLDPRNHEAVTTMALHGRRKAESMSPETYNLRLLDIAREVGSAHGSERKSYATAGS